MIETMRERITIQKSKTGNDKNGNHTLIWEDYYSCYAYVNNLSGNEYWAAAQVNAQSDLYFIVRYCSEIKNMDSEHYRIIFRDQIYNISFLTSLLTSCTLCFTKSVVASAYSVSPVIMVSAKRSIDTVCAISSPLYQTCT